MAELRLAGIDLNELFCSQAIHCDHTGIGR